MDDSDTYSLENNIVLVTKQTIDEFLKQRKPADLIALYIFYAYTAKWQQTNVIRATTGYTAAGLGWTEDRVRKAKAELIKMNLIEDSVSYKSGKIAGHFVKIRYMFRKDTIERMISVDGEPAKFKQEEAVVKEPAKKEKIDYQAIADDYNSTCTNLSRVTVVSEARKRAIRGRLKEYSLEQIHTIFEKANNSKFLTGSTSGNRTFRANFDWLMKDANAAKVLDGNYDDRTPESKKEFYGSDDTLPF